MCNCLHTILACYWFRTSSGLRQTSKHKKAILENELSIPELNTLGVDFGAWTPLRIIMAMGFPLDH